MEHMSHSSGLGLATSKDPVCGMDVPLDSPLRLERQGTIYRFCSQSCLDRFRAQREPIATAPPDAGFTCPMHSEVVSDKAGKCPKCGMALKRTSASTKPAAPHQH